jgi:inorganic triphosphatase YgiF
MVAYGGGSAAVAYFLFQWLGKTWIENKFAQRLDQLRHQQALELQRLRVEIDAMLSGALKLQEKEFSVLPEAWAKLDEAHGLVSWLVAPYQQYADVNRMNSIQLDEFLAGTDFYESQKQDIRNATDKNKTFQDISFWHRLNKVKNAFSELQTYVARNGIFLPPALELKFRTIAEMLWSAVISKEVGHEAKDWKMQREGWEKIKAEAEPLYLDIKTNIQDRLHSHGHRKPNY